MAAALVLDAYVAEDAVSRRFTLAQMRRRKLLSAYALGIKAHVAASTVIAIENGARPRLSTIGKLCKALDCRPDEIEWPGDPLDLGDDPDEGRADA